MILQTTFSNIVAMRDNASNPQDIKRINNAIAALPSCFDGRIPSAILFSSLVQRLGAYEATLFAFLFPPAEREWRAFALWCCNHARDVLTDDRSRNALNVVKRYIQGTATKKDLQTARVRALDAIFGHDSYDRRLFNRLFHIDRKEEAGGNVISPAYTQYRNAVLHEASKVGLAEERIAMEAAAGTTNPSPIVAALIASGWMNDRLLGSYRVNGEAQASILAGLMNGDSAIRNKLC